MTLNQITLIGVGLIGGSFVLDLKRQRLVRTVIGIDTRPANLERALERRVIDTAASQNRLGSLCAQAQYSGNCKIDTSLLPMPAPSRQKASTQMPPLLASAEGCPRRLRMWLYSIKPPLNASHSVVAWNSSAVCWLWRIRDSSMAMSG